jgi:hypothetical protein
VRELLVAPGGLRCAAGGEGESWLAGLGWSVQGSDHFIAGDFRHVALGDGNARSSLLIISICWGPGIKLHAYFEHVVVSVASGEGVTLTYSQL